VVLSVVVLSLFLAAVRGIQIGSRLHNTSPQCNFFSTRQIQFCQFHLRVHNWDQAAHNSLCLKLVGWLQVQGLSDLDRVSWLERGLLLLLELGLLWS
jgi:hypothetical protein